MRTSSEKVYQGGISPNGRTVASGSSDYAIRLWDLESGKPLRVLTGHEGTVHSFDFSPDGRVLASGGLDCNVMLWDVATGKKLRTLTGCSETINSLAFSPDGKLIAAGTGSYTGDVSEDNAIRIWDVASGKIVHILNPGPGTSISSVSFSPENRILACAVDGGDNDIELWDVAKEKKVRTFKGRVIEFMEPQYDSVAFSPDGKLIASGGGDSSVGTVEIWDIASGRVVHNMAGHDRWVNSVAFSPDGRRLASGSGDRTIKIWDVNTGKELHTLNGHTIQVLSVTFIRSGRTLASGSYDCVLKLWDVGSGKCLRTIGPQKSQRLPRKERKAAAKFGASLFRRRH